MDLEEFTGQKDSPEEEAPKKKQSEMTETEAIEYVASLFQVEPEEMVEAAECVAPILVSVISFFQQCGHMKLSLSTESRNFMDNQSANFALSRLLLTYEDFRKIIAKKEDQKQREKYENPRQATPEEVEELEKELGAE